MMARSEREPTYRLLASPTSSVLTRYCTNTSARLLLCTPSMADLLELANVGQLGKYSIGERAKYYLSRTHELLRFGPLGGLRLCVVVIDSTVDMASLAPKSWRNPNTIDTVHYDREIPPA